MSKKSIQKIKKPLVSVVVTTFNDERFIGRCLNSLQAQHYNNFEVILVDNSSQDRTRQIAYKFKNKLRIKIIIVRKTTLAEARNIGIKKTNGKYVSFCDADDIHLPWKICDQIKSLKKKSNLDGCYGEWIHFTASNPCVFYFKRKAQKFCNIRNLLLRMPFNLSTLMIKKDKMPFFVEGKQGSCAEDWQFIILCGLKKLKLEKVNQIFSCVEERSDSYSKKVYATQKIVFAKFLFHCLWSYKYDFKTICFFIYSICINVIKFILIKVLLCLKNLNQKVISKTKIFSQEKICHHKKIKKIILAY